VRSNFPTEEEQYFVYRKLVEGMPGKEITFRTLDIGGDKILPYSGGPKRDNPFLGLRSIRFSLKHKNIFADQVRAILRAGEGAKIRIMFPMISSLEEFLESKAVVAECARELAGRGIPHADDPDIGMMVEVPAVVEIIDSFARHADFFSIGTNDLVQYMLAVDRTNEEVADRYLPHHPAVLKAIYAVASSGARHGVAVSVCGDMANNARYLPFLIGAGIRDVSMNPRYLVESQKAIAALDSREAARLTAELLGLPGMREIEEALFRRQ
jgi:Phosphoenolpyruvate-protein kinase (PTS system EI component in bacteria)